MICSRFPWSGVLLTATILMPLASQADTLADAVSTALKSSHYLQEQENLIQSAEQDISLEQRARQVQINVSADAGVSQRLDDSTRSQDNDDVKKRTGAGVTARWDFFDGGRYASRLSAAELRAEMSRQSRENVRDEVIMKSLSIYYDLFRYKRLLAFNTDLLKEYDRLASHVEKRVNSGNAPSYELDEIRLSRSDVEFNRQELLLKQFEASEAYQTDIGPIPANLEEPEGPSGIFSGQPVAHWQQQAVSENARLQEEKLRQQELQQRVEMARSDLMPTAGVEVSHRWDYGVDGIAGDRTDTSALLKVSWQLFGQNRSAQISKAVAELEAARSRYAYLEAEVMRTIRLSSFSRKTAIKAMANYRQDLNRIDQLLAISDQRMNLGSGANSSVQNVLKVLKQYQRAQEGFLNAFYDGQLYSYRLLHSAGVLDQNFDLASTR